MRSISYLLIVLLAAICSSCVDILEEIQLNKNGSGQYRFTIDARQMAQRDGFWSDFGSSVQAADADNGLVHIDTTFHFADFPAEELADTDRPAFWEKVAMRKVLDEANKTAYAVVEFPFEQLDDIVYFTREFRNLSMLQHTNLGVIPVIDLDIVRPSNLSFQYTGRTFSAMPTQMPDEPVTESETAPLFEDVDPDNGLLTALKETMSEAMLQMKEKYLSYFAEYTYTITYDMPRRIKKSTIVDARIHGNTLTVEVPMSDLMNFLVTDTSKKPENLLSGYIYMKKR